MPSEDDDPTSYKNFTDLFWIMLAGFCVSWIYTFYKQTDVDIFFIDWEESKHSDEF